MTGLTLAVDAPAEVPLDEALVVVVRLRNDGPAPVLTSSALDLVQGDLALAVAPAAGGAPVRVDWPWPVDAARRETTLGVGEELVGSALLLSATMPPFPEPGDYAVTATFTPQPGVAVESVPVVVARPAARDRARQRALGDREVVQSLCSMSTIGSAAEGLALLAASDDAPVAQLLATCVTTVTAELPPAVARAVAAAGPGTVAAALAAVLPPGLFPGDERLAVAAQAVGADGTATHLLSGTATPSG